MAPHKMPFTILPVAVSALLVAGVTACGDSRSPTAFCQVYREQKSAYLAKYSGTGVQGRAVNSKDPLVGLFSGIARTMEAVGDVVIIFDKLDKASPDDIEPDVAAIRDSLKAQVSSAGGAYKDPIGGLIGNLASSLTTIGSWDRVGKYVVTNCGENA